MLRWMEVLAGWITTLAFALKVNSFKSLIVTSVVGEPQYYITCGKQLGNLTALLPVAGRALRTRVHQRDGFELSRKLSLEGKMAVKGHLPYQVDSYSLNRILLNR